MSNQSWLVDATQDSVATKLMLLLVKDVDVEELLVDGMLLSCLPWLPENIGVGVTGGRSWKAVDCGSLKKKTTRCRGVGGDGGIL